MKNLLAKMFFLFLLAHWFMEGVVQRTCLGPGCNKPLGRTDHWHYDGVRFHSEACRTAYKKQAEGSLLNHREENAHHELPLQGDPGDETKYDPQLRLDLE